MFSPFSRACVMLALVLSLGLHWTVLQSAAWVGMIVSYSQDGSLGEALEKTFDGEHPCELCRMVERGTAASPDAGENQDSSVPSKDTLKKMDLFSSISPNHFFGRSSFESADYPDFRPSAENRAEQPAVPPPQVA